MFLELDINEESEIVTFKLQSKKRLSENRHLWTMVSNGKTLYKYSLKFIETANILQEIIETPANLSNKSELLKELITGLLKVNYEEEKEGFDNSDFGDTRYSTSEYNIRKTKIQQVNFSIGNIFELMEQWGQIELNADFQRNFVWNSQQQSQLIESILLNFPIPSFYLAETESGKYQVVDGLQRLTTIRNFIKNKFTLQKLEYLIDLQGQYFEDLDGQNSRIIQSTVLHAYIIESKSPPLAKFDIFRRLNRGGEPLNNQEIRNSLMSKEFRILVNDLVNSESFQQATGNSILNTRMQAQELVLRYVAFYHQERLELTARTYHGNMTLFLDETIELFNQGKLIISNVLINVFYDAMKCCYHLFGKYAFRKCLPTDLEHNRRRPMINKSLFTVWSVLMSEYSLAQIENRIEFGTFAFIFANELELNQELFDAVSYATNNKKSLDLVFSVCRKLIKENLNL